MIGPSSSHTAGAVRIGWLAGKIAGKEPREVKLGFRKGLMNTYKGHATDTGLVAGILGYREDDERVRTSLQEAAEKGIKVTVEEITEPGHPNEMKCEITTVDGIRTIVSGISVGGGSVLIKEIDGVEVNLDGFTGGYLLRSKSGGISEDLLRLLWNSGFWAGPEPDSSSGKPTADNHRASESLTFVPGPKELDRDFLNNLTSRFGVEMRWVPPLYPGNKNPKERRQLFKTADEFLSLCRESRIPVPQLIAEYEKEFSGLGVAETRQRMKYILDVMKESVKTGLEEPLRLVGGFANSDDAKLVWKRAITKKSLGGGFFTKAIARALATMEVNAAMGKVVAAPTAGSCGVLPGVILTIAEDRRLSDEDLVDGLLVAAGTGIIIGNVASFSGAVGGCQGEVGVASAISAASAVYLCGGSIEEAFHGAAMAIKNVLGLACDPAAGPVEIPCIKRNAGGVAIALSAAEMALAGVRSVIPFDEVVLALKNVQDLMPEDLRDNTMGGLGSTPTAGKIKEAWEKKCRCLAFPTTAK